MIEGGLLIAFDGDSAPINLRFRLSDADIHLLKGFLREAEQLIESIKRIGGLEATFQLSAHVASGVQIRTTEPLNDDRAVLLHRLRPLILQKEPYAFHKACSVISKSTSDAFLRSHVKGLRSLFFGEQLQQSITISHGGLVLNSEKGFLYWLNGFEYHREKEKADAIASGADLLTISHLRPIYITMVKDKVRAIEALSVIAAKMLEPAPG